MKRILLIAVATVSVSLGCGGTDVKDFGGYGDGHPGQGLKHGGQVFLELVHRPDTWTGDQGWIHAYKRSYGAAASVPETLPLPPIPAGTCMDISTSTFPRQFGDVTYGDLGASFTLTPEDSSAPTLTADKKENFVDNLQYFVESGYQNNPFDATTITNDMFYDITFDGSDALEPNRIYMPPAYEIYSPAIGKEDLVFTRGEELVFNWDPINQDEGGSEHSPKRTFTNVIFVGFPQDTNDDMMPDYQFKVVCPINDGAGHDTFAVPASVIDSLPDAGIAIMGQPTHMMGKLGDERFDLIAIECNQSKFSFAE